MVGLNAKFLCVSNINIYNTLAYYNYLYKRSIFSRFYIPKVWALLMHKNYLINFLWPHASQYLGWDDQKLVISIVQTNVFYAVTEKYPL